jgi:hypothetical protein
MSDRIEDELAAILASPNYPLAEDDHDFLESDAARPSRLALEFLRADHYLRERGIASTVVVFGGARIVEPLVAQAQLASAEALPASNPHAAALLAQARRALRYSHYYDEARSLARILSTARSTAGQRDFVITTGGGPGIMEAANRGAAEAGAPSIGFNIRLPREQQPNRWITPGLAFSFHYFALRKMHFLLRARALVAFPGGYGTLDELFEALNLVQTGKIAPIPIVLVGREHWSRVISLDYLVDEGFIGAEDRELVQCVDSGAEAAGIIEARYR